MGLSAITVKRGWKYRSGMAVEPPETIRQSEIGALTNSLSPSYALRNSELNASTVSCRLDISGCRSAPQPSGSAASCSAKPNTVPGKAPETPLGRRGVPKREQPLSEVAAFHGQLAGLGYFPFPG